MIVRNFRQTLNSRYFTAALALALTAPLMPLSHAQPPAGVAPTPPTPPPPPETRRIVIEAEDMRGVAQDKFGPGAGWQVGRWGQDLYQNMVFGGVWASRLRVAMADASATPSEVHSDITVSEAGTYKVWAKYEAPPYFNYAFGIRVEPLGPGGKPGKAVFTKTYGLLDSPKHFSFTNTLKKGSLYWNWGIDHDAAEGYEVPLKAGRYRVTMAKVANPAPAAARSVDTIMITSDLSPVSSPKFPRYPLLDELRRANHVYFRFRNTSSQAARVAWNHWGHRYNDFYYAQYRDLVRFYDAAGKPLDTPVKTGDWPEPIAAGGTSVWYDLGPTLNVESSSPFRLKAVAEGENVVVDGPKPSLPFAVDIALAPDAKRIVKSFALDTGEPDLVFLLQPDLNRQEGVDTSRKLADIYTDVTRQLNAEPRLGPIPKDMKIFGATTGPRSPYDDIEITQGFRHALGLNTFESNMINRAQLDAISAWWQPHGGLIKRSLVYHHSQDPAAVAEMMKKADVVPYLHYISYGDEIGLPTVDVTDPKVVAAFVEYVKAQGETLQTLGVAGWEQVKPLNTFSTSVALQTGVLPAGTPAGDDQVNKLKRLYWYSGLFRAHSGIESFIGKTKGIKNLLGNEVQTTANLGGMHPFYWMHQSAFIESFKHNSMSLAWSEDYTYTQPEASRLIADFDAAYLRKGASYNDQRMMFYCMPHYPGNSPQLLMQNAVMQWANNVKDLDWFIAAPDGWQTENYVAYRGGLPMWKVLRQVSGMAGLIEDDLVPARPERAPVAMLLSEASDVWELEGKSQNDVFPPEDGKPASAASNISQEERKNLWYALRQAGYRVDFVTEDDVKEGLLKNYKALYVCGQNLQRASADGIKQWVQDGGVLFATAGAARKNEFDEPLTTLDEVLGRGAQKTYQRFRGPLRAKLELLFEKPLDSVKVGATSLEALASKEIFTPAADAQVLGTYAAEGGAAWVKHTFGKGTAYYTGALPGQTYVKKSLPMTPAGKGGSETSPALREPSEYDAVAADLILRPLRDAAIAPDMTIAHRGVISGRLTSPKSTVLPLVNLAEQHDGQLKNLKFTVDNIAAKPTKVWSCFNPKGVPFEYAGGKLTFSLPTLQTADVVVISK